MSATLSLAVAVSVGLIPQMAGAAGAPSVQPVAATQVGPAAAPPVTVSPPPPPPPTTAPPTTAPPATTPKVTRRATPKATVADTTSAAPAPASTTAPRNNPSSAEVQAAIAQLHQRIPFYTVTEAQARQFGDQVCSAFDAGQSSAEVVAAVLAAVPQNLFVHVSSADAQFAVTTAVQLFCPGYLSKVG